MNGNTKYNRRGGGMGEMARYGTVPIYGAAKDLNADELHPFLKRNGGSLPDLEGLPNSPPTFNSRASGAKARFGNDLHFRVQFGKPRRLTHIYEAKEFHKVVEPYAADGVYVNYMDKDDDERVNTAHGERYERLVELKNEWDPGNLFRTNQNIEPTV